MCASYGLGGGTSLPPGLGPMSEPGDLVLLNEWVEQFGGHAKITGSRAKNLNPVIHELDGTRTVELGWWSIWRDGSGPAGRWAFNSRDDSLIRYWRAPFQRRALLPASWYDEGRKSWSLPDGSAFAIAAITSTVVEDATGEERVTYSMVTRSGVGEAASVVSSRGDSRMPLVLPATMYDEWLDPARPGDADLVDQVQLASDEISRAMTAGE